MRWIKGHKASGQEIKWRRHRVVRSAFQSQRAVAGGGQQSRKDRLQDERGAPRGPDSESVIPRRNWPRAKLQRLGTQGRTFHLGTTNRLGGLHCGQMLLQQPRLLPFGSNTLHPERLSSDQRQRQ